MTSDRRRYQREVASLLDTIRESVDKLERLRGRGLRGRALADEEAELARVRSRLASLVSERENADLATPQPHVEKRRSFRPGTARGRPATLRTPALR